MPIDFATDTTVTDAMSKLEAAEAAEPNLPQEAFEQTADGKLQQSEAAAENTGDPQPESLTDDTRAAAEQKTAEATENKTETQTEVKTEAKADKKSEFARSGERLDKTWKAVNEAKAAQAATEATLKAREQAIAQREEQVNLQAAKAKQKFTPDQYDTAAANKLASVETLELQARGLDAKSKEHEDAGEYGKSEMAKQQAQDLLEQAAGEKYSAKQLKEMGEQLRKNPEPTLQQHQAKMEQHRRHYLLEAAKVWPDVAKDGSEFQKSMAGHLQAAAQQGLDANENPILFYHVARLTAAETTAARVPKLEKDLGAAQARVKELEKLTAPGGGSGATQRIVEKKTSLNDDEEAAELRAFAESRS